MQSTLKPQSLVSLIALVLAMAGVTVLSHGVAQGQRQLEGRDAANKTSRMRLPDLPRQFEELSSSVRGPEDIDQVTEKLGISPRLINFNLATAVDLSDIGLGRAVHIPVQISDKEGGRKSLYFLDSGEEALAGIFVNEDGLALRYVKRQSGEGTPARTGDSYQIRITTLDGKTIHEEQGRLKVIDPKIGKGELVIAGRGLRHRRVWILWSCILVERRGY